MKYSSNATWTKINNSKDTHTTKEMAQGICDRLLRDYGTNKRCQTRGRCLSAWVEEVKDKENNIDNK